MLDAVAKSHALKSQTQHVELSTVKSQLKSSFAVVA